MSVLQSRNKRDTKVYKKASMWDIPKGGVFPHWKLGSKANDDNT